MKVVCRDCGEVYWCPEDRGCPHCRASRVLTRPTVEAAGGIPQEAFEATLGEVERARKAGHE